MIYEPVRIIETASELNRYIKENCFDLKYPYDVRFLPDGSVEVYIVDKVVATYMGNRQ
jgi:hypothetical protein